MSESGAPLGPAALVRTEKDQAWTRIKGSGANLDVSLIRWVLFCGLENGSG
jgi:hypothetical protein